VGKGRISRDHPRPYRKGAALNAPNFGGSLLLRLCTPFDTELCSTYGEGWFICGEPCTYPMGSQALDNLLNFRIRTHFSVRSYDQSLSSYVACARYDMT